MLRSSTVDVRGAGATPGAPRPHPHPGRGVARVPRGPWHAPDLAAPHSQRRPRRRVDRGARDEGHPRARQGEGARAGGRGRSHRARRARGRARDQLPHLGVWPARRGAGRARPQAGRRCRGAAQRPGAVPGDAGHDARGDSGHRARGDRVRHRGPRRCRARAGRRELVRRRPPRHRWRVVEPRERAR